MSNLGKMRGYDALWDMTKTLDDILAATCQQRGGRLTCQGNLGPCCPGWRLSARCTPIGRLVATCCYTGCSGPTRRTGCSSSTC